MSYGNEAHRVHTHLFEPIVKSLLSLAALSPPPSNVQPPCSSLASRAQAASDLGGRSARSLLCCPGSRTQSRFEELSFDVGVGRIWPPISLVGILLDYRRELESLGLWPPEWRVATSSATRHKHGGVTRWSHDTPAGPWRSVSGRCRKWYVFDMHLLSGVYSVPLYSNPTIARAMPSATPISATQAVGR